MPFKSEAQRAFMYSQHPAIAKRWRKEAGPQKELPKFKASDKQKKHLAQGYRNGKATAK